MTDLSVLAPGTVLENNYQILHEIGRGGFARTYLANNLRRFNEQCVLKQFAPEGGGNTIKATELFDREASVMYKLDHDQIPKFREQFKAYTSTGESLFIVQDYVAGDNYWQLVDGRSQLFSELEACEFLRKVLPVLGYIHACGVIHRDISPDNIICRAADGLPVLIDFGAVREAGAKYSHAQSTIVGKIGFAPAEQMQMGEVGAHSDLYALAATTLALLTGKDPENLYNSMLGRWHWQHLVHLSPAMTKVLEKMLAHQPKNRYQSAGAVLADLPQPHQLSGQASPAGRPVSAIFSQLKTMVVAPKAPAAVRPNTQTPTVSVATKAVAKKKVARSTTATAEWKKPATGVSKLVGAALLVAIAGAAGWNWLTNVNWQGASLPTLDTKEFDKQLKEWSKFDLGKTISGWIPKSFDPLKSVNDSLKSFDPMKSVNGAIKSVTQSNPIDFKGQGEVSEKTIQAKSQAVQKKLQAEGRSIDKFAKQVDKVFYKKHPELKKRTLQPGDRDRQLRYEWWSIAEGLVE
jgi:serine/threonine protein kinase